jgi:hypothetical protein
MTTMSFEERKLLLAYIGRESRGPTKSRQVEEPRARAALEKQIFLSYSVYSRARFLSPLLPFFLSFFLFSVFLSIVIFNNRMPVHLPVPFF